MELWFNCIIRNWTVDRVLSKILKALFWQIVSKIRRRLKRASRKTWDKMDSVHLLKTVRKKYTLKRIWKCEKITQMLRFGNKWANKFGLLFIAATQISLEVKPWPPWAFVQRLHYQEPRTNESHSIVFLRVILSPSVPLLHPRLVSLSYAISAFI